MADALRATRGVPGFHAALDLHLVEINAPLRALQRTCARRLRADLARALRRRAGGADCCWSPTNSSTPCRCASSRRRRSGWRERMVGLARRRRDAASCAWRRASTPYAALSARRARPAPRPKSPKPAAPSPRAIGARLRRDGGWALIVDYGYDERLGASLQAVRGHRGAGILDRPGETDLSAHVDFAALARGHRHADLRAGRPGRLPAAAGNHAACRDLKARAGEAQRARHRRGIGALDRARPNGHPVPRPGRGRRQKRRAGRLFGQTLGRDMIQAKSLAELDGVQHRFFTRRGGVSAGLYSSLNCGYGSGDQPDNVRENRRRAAADVRSRRDRAPDRAPDPFDRRAGRRPSSAGPRPARPRRMRW